MTSKTTPSYTNFIHLFSVGCSSNICSTTLNITIIMVYIMYTIPNNKNNNNHNNIVFGTLRNLFDESYMRVKNVSHS